MLKPAHVIEDDESLAVAITALASAMADASRVKMLCALMDGRAWTATELATVAEVSASTASAHLSRLVSTHLLVCLAQGRHRYYRLASADVAGLLENMMAMAGKSLSSCSDAIPRTSRLSPSTSYWKNLNNSVLFYARLKGRSDHEVCLSDRFAGCGGADGVAASRGTLCWVDLGVTDDRPFC